MTNWPIQKEDLVRPAYRSLARKMVEAIESGDLAAGTQLPTHRALSYELGLSVQTVSRAYDELSRMGFIVGEVGRGSFVRGRNGDAQVPWSRSSGGSDLIDCSMLVPVTGDIHAQHMAKTLGELSKDPPQGALFSFRPRSTLERHVTEAARWISLGGVQAAPDRIIPTNGNTAAMCLALQTAALPNELIVTETLGHHTLKSLTTTLGLRLQGLEIDSEGIVPDAFEAVCRNDAVKALFLMPSGLGPTCAFAGAERRQTLCDIAKRYGVWIIESDAWGPINPERAPSFAELAPERTFYFTGVTKCLLPGLRLGWLVVPEAMISAARNRHLVTNWMATPLMAEIATRWIVDGTAQTLLSWQRKNLHRRNAIVKSKFGSLDFASSPYGLHVWLPLPEPWKAQDFVEHARNEGVAVASSSNFRTGELAAPEAVRVCVGVGTEQKLAQGLSIVARLAGSLPEPALLGT
ncbi:MAG: PLP-dependent aminotransferase family protein [Roseibium sp.]|uniref:MocR-like ectoine utilization transcription factor EhuR n=1 Tax=Roseibium sp. TaxID=1936156 RepID=UPI003D9C6480